MVLPGEHDNTMRNFVLAQALPAASNQLFVFFRQILHPLAGDKRETSSSRLERHKFSAEKES